MVWKQLAHSNGNLIPVNHFIPLKHILALLQSLWLIFCLTLLSRNGWRCHWSGNRVMGCIFSSEVWYSTRNDMELTFVSFIFEMYFIWPVPGPTLIIWKFPNNLRLRFLLYCNGRWRLFYCFCLSGNVLQGFWWEFQLLMLTLCSWAKLYIFIKALIIAESRYRSSLTWPSLCPQTVYNCLQLQ